MPKNIDRDDLPNVKILLLLHHKEYLNAGNSAKSLIALLPEENIELYVYGKEGDFDRCIDEMMRLLLGSTEDNHDNTRNSYIRCAC